jgi:hypothetical protein
MANLPTRKEFFELMVRAWGDEMSSPAQLVLSIVVSALLLIVGLGFAINKSWEGALATLAVAVGALHLATYKLWAKERQEVVRLHDKTVPKLKCTFDKSHGCQHKTKLNVTTNAVTGYTVVIASSDVRYFRVRMEVEGIGIVREVSGHLLSLTRDGKLLFDGHAIPLPIAPAEEDLTVRDIRAGVPVYLDVFILMDTGSVKIASPGFVLPAALDPSTLFSGPGEYRFHVVVSAAESAPVSIDLVLKWTGDWLTSEAYAG